MRFHVPTIHCDGDEGSCDAWAVDNYEGTASTVDGVRITRQVRAPGWVSTEATDLCPEHANTSKP